MKSKLFSIILVSLLAVSAGLGFDRVVLFECFTSTT
jgi:hypothetical protein